MTREFFRIVRNQPPSIDDFRSARELGVPRPAIHIAEWDRGISIYDDLEYALRRALRNRSGLGRFVARLIVPADGSVEFAKTFGRHHYTVYGDPGDLIALVREPIFSAIHLDEDVN